MKATGLVHGYRKRKPLGRPQDLAAIYFEKVESREASEIERTRQTIQLCAANECQAGMLSAHFGQPLSEPCGQCSFCLGEGPFAIPAPVGRDLDDSTVAAIRTLVAEKPGAINTSRAVARLLCGIRSPALTRAKLTQHPLFDSCQDIPFDAIMQQVQSQIEFSSEAPF